MAEVSETLGQRIVLAARMAVAMHLGQTFAELGNQRQQPELDGVKRMGFTDEALSPAGGRPRRPPHIAEGGAA